MGLGDPKKEVWQHRFPGPAQLPPSWLVASWGRWSPIGWLLFLSSGKLVPGRIWLEGPTGRTGGTASSPPPAPGQQGLCSTCTHRQAGGQSQPPSLAAPPPSEGRHSRHRGGTSLLSLALLGPQHRSGTGKPILQVGHAYTQKPASPRAQQVRWPEGSGRGPWRKPGRCAAKPAVGQHHARKRG